jgi:uncharacterized membrane protein YecN with MAPEG domain
MSIASWTLIAFAAWTLLILMFGVGTRRWALILSRRAVLTSFPGDTAHGDSAYRRAVRAHANCVENLPVYGAIVLSAEVFRLTTVWIDTLAVGVILCRIAQSSIHMLLPETNATVGVRFSFFTAQVVAMIWMIVTISLSAMART